MKKYTLIGIAWTISVLNISASLNENADFPSVVITSQHANQYWSPHHYQKLFDLRSFMYNLTTDPHSQKVQSECW